MSLVVWLPLNGNLENQGLSNVTVTNNGATVDNNGKIGKCYNFNGSSTYLNLNKHVLSQQAEASIAFWAYPNGTSLNGAFSMENNTYWQITFADGLVCLRDSNAGLGGSRSDIAIGSIVASQWIHIVVTYKNGKFTLYKNGTIAGSSSPGGTALNVLNWFSIGKNHQNSAFFNGKLNDVRVYNNCLSEKEVKELSKGLVLHYRLAGPGGANLLPGTHINENTTTYPTSNYSDRNISSIKTDVLNGTTYTVSFEAKSTHNGDKIRIHFYNPSNIIKGIGSQGQSNTASDGNMDFTLSDKWEKYWATYTIPANGNTSRSVIIARVGASGSGYPTGTGTLSFRHEKVEKGSVATPWCPHRNDTLYGTMGYNNNIEYDCSGHQRNGTKIGTITWDIDSPRYTTSYKFNGAEAIKKNNFIFTTNKWTISLWYKYSSSPTTYEGLCCLSKGDGSDINKKIAIMPNTNYIWFKAENTSYTLQSLKINEWCHLAITCDGTKVVIYENAIQKGTTSPSSFYTDTSDLVVGARSSSSGAATTSVYSKAKISDFRIYSTTLSAEDIAELYHTAAIVDNQNNMYAYEYVEEEVHA